jgi:crotonobetainyl-CoA:carnitine CoA-transferase CaiB-like acyl-CoA transferase
MKEQQQGALSVYRILDLTDHKGSYCTKLLADLGADVIKVEGTEGDPTRRFPPFVDDEPHVEKSLYFHYRNANKRGITLNLETSDGKTIFKKLVKTADVLVESYPPGYMKKLALGYPLLKEINPGLVMASITEFGQTGPYKNRKGSDIVHFANSGGMIISGFPDKAPCNAPGPAAYDSSSTIAAISILVALYSRGSTGQGQYIDNSVQESAMIGLYPWIVPVYSYGITDDGAPEPVTRNGGAIYPVLSCKDGYVRVIGIFTPRQWETLVKILGNPEVLLLPEWQDWIYRAVNADALRALLQEFTQDYTMTELVEMGHKEGVPICPVATVADFINSPHTRAREFFVEVNHPETGKALYPGLPYKFTETPGGIRRPAPCLGQHNEEVYCREIGLTKQDLAALVRAGVL